MSNFIPPRRARLKRRQSEVRGVSFVEQKMIEKALKQSLQDCYSKQSSSDESDSSSLNLSHKSTLLKKPQQSNVAKKTAIRTPSLSSERLRLLRISKNVSKADTKDPAYIPCMSAPITGLPPKRSIERHSKAFTYLKINISTESDDDDNDDDDDESFEAEVNSNRCPSPARSCTSLSSGEEDVIVISDSSDSSSSDSTSFSEDDSWFLRATKDSAEKSYTENEASSSDCMSLLKNKQPTSTMTTNKMSNVKTQKILFKAVKKSSSFAPMGVIKPDKKIKIERMSGIEIQSKKNINKSTTNKKQETQKIQLKVKGKNVKSNYSKHHVASSNSSNHSVGLPLFAPNPFVSNKLDRDSDTSSWSSASDDDFLMVQRPSTPTRDGGDRSSYQAQRKFAAYSSPSSQSNGYHSPAISTDVTCSIPSTEDFLLFLCLRNSGVLPEPLKIFNSPWTPHKPHSRLPRINDITLRPLSLAKKMATNVS